MKVKRFFAKNMQAGLKEISQILGADAVILNHHKVEGGVEIVAGVDVDAIVQNNNTPKKYADLKLQQQNLAFEEPRTETSVAVPAESKKKWEKSDIIKSLKSKVSDEKSISELLMELREQAIPEDDDADDFLNQIPAVKKSKLESMMEKDPSFAISARSLQKKIARNYSSGSSEQLKPKATDNRAKINQRKREVPTQKEVNNEKKQSEDYSKSIEKMFERNQTQQSDQWDKMQSEISELRNKISDQQTQLENQKQAPKQKIKVESVFSPKTHEYWHSSLNEFGLTEHYRNKILHALEGHAEIDWTLISKSLVNHMDFFKESVCEKGGVFTLLGPTGAGKTTTIGKLASQYVMANGKASVGIICMDHHQIGAQSSLKLISDILDVSFLSVSNEDYLINALDQLKDKSLVLIDTGGSALAVNDYLEQFVLVEQEKEIKHLLCLPATASHFSLNQYQSLIKILPIHSAIITKLDESICAGSAMSCVMERKLPTSYLTVGQNIPKDINQASARSLFTLIDGYKHISHIANNELVG